MTLQLQVETSQGSHIFQTLFMVKTIWHLATGAQMGCDRRLRALLAALSLACALAPSPLPPAVKAKAGEHLQAPTSTPQHSISVYMHVKPKKQGRW